MPLKLQSPDAKFMAEMRQIQFLLNLEAQMHRDPRSWASSWNLGAGKGREWKGVEEGEGKEEKWREGMLQNLVQGPTCSKQRARAALGHE